MVTELAKNARLRPVAVPKVLVAEPHYRPSAPLARFVRCRDLTCRWPGCDQPAVACDIDHTVPYPAGPTHPSNNKLYCRIHHLLSALKIAPRACGLHLARRSECRGRIDRTRLADRRWSGLKSLCGNLPRPGRPRHARSWRWQASPTGIAK
jgi:hypothetical protein